MSVLPLRNVLTPSSRIVFQRLVERGLIGRKEIIPNCGRARFIDHFKRPVGRLKPIDVDAYFGAVLSKSTRQSRLNEFWIARTFLRTPAYSSQPYPIAMGTKKSWPGWQFFVPKSTNCGRHTAEFLKKYGSEKSHRVL